MSKEENNGETGALSPDEMDASELVLSLLAEAPSEAFVLTKTLPDGSTKKVRLRIQLVRTEEAIMCLSRAQKAAQHYGELKGYGEIYKEMQATELLSKAIRRGTLSRRADGTEYYPQLFVDSKQLRESFTENELSLCLNAYEVTKAKFAHVESFDPDELDKWATRLSDTLTGPFWLQRLDFSHWPALMTGLALEVQQLREEVSRPLSSSLESTESESENSPSGTGGSGPSPGESLSDEQGSPIRSDRLLTRDEAMAIAKKKRSKK